METIKSAVEEASRSEATSKFRKIDVLQQVVSVIRTYSEDIPNRINRIGCVIITIMLFINVLTCLSVVWKINDVEKAIMGHSIEVTNRLDKINGQ